MRHDLLGLPLSMARRMLADEGLEPEITTTRAPKRTEEPACLLRVVYASDDGRKLTVSPFVDPIADGVQENG